jgi:hypothetical protein
VKRLFPSAKEDCVAALQAKGRRVGGHIRPGFIDDPDEPQRCAHLSDAEAVGEHALLDDGANRIRELSDLIDTVGDSV